LPADLKIINWQKKQYFIDKIDLANLPHKSYSEKDLIQ